MKIKDTRKYWVWLSNACGAGSKPAVNLVRHFGDAYSVFCADQNELSSCPFRLDSRVLSKVSYKDLCDAEEIVEWCDSCGVKILCPDQNEYPVSLKALSDAPMVLYCIGKLPDWSETLMCALVGTRKMSEYGSEMSYNFGYNIAACGGCIVSGLALGCDSQAIRGALKAKGKTVSVLGCGIDIVYPRESRDLFDKVIENGAIITEYSPGTSPVGSHFPVRNRIISGISQAVCVIEGNIKSGSLITARHAFYQNKDIFAVPGRVGDRGSEGTNLLIKTGAVAVTDPMEIVESFQYSYPHSIEVKKAEKPWVREVEEEADVKILPRKKKEKKKKENSPKEPIFPQTNKAIKMIDFETLGEDEKRIYNAMTPDIPMLADEICSASGVSVALVMASLTLLEMAGAVESGAGGYYMRHRDDDEVGEPAITEFDSGL